MTNDEQDRILERLRMGRASRAETGTTPAASSRPAAARGFDRFPIGARVFDVLLGQDGTIVAPPPDTANVVGRVYVKFDSGITNARQARDLMVRPTPPGARS